MAYPGFDGNYPDDIVSTARDIYNSYEYPDEEPILIKKLLQFTVEMADRRANKKHGFQASEEEKAFKPDYMKLSELLEALKSYKYE